MPYLLLVLTTLFWSGNFVISRGMHAAIPPFALSFWRWALAFLILAFFGLRHLRAERQLAMQHKKFLIIQGLLGVAGFNSFIYYAMQTTTAINAALVNSCTPIIIVLISWARFKDRLSLRQCLGVAISLGGVLLIISRGDLTTLLQLQFNHGDILVFIAACLWAFYSVNLKKYPRDLHPLAYQTAIAMVGLTTLLPLYLLEIASGKTMPVTTSTVITIVYVAVFASVLAFIFWSRAVSTLGANIAGPFIHLMPAFSTILAVFFLGETLTKNHVMAIILIFGGIFMTTFRVKRKQKFIKILSVCLMVTGILSHQPLQAKAGETLLGFAEAWQKINEENDTLAAAKANLDQARHKKDAARDLYLPEVEFRQAICTSMTR